MTFNPATNNLDKSSSPYLRQHAENPVHWQEWSSAVLEYARSEDKPLFVSVGYSTCHWCHVMADDTFSDPDCASFLNQHFVSIKIDREQRPDIDQFMMAFLVATQGSGGWPLSVFLSPELSPFFATTYLGSQPKFGRPGFRSVLRQILDFYTAKRESLSENTVSLPTEPVSGTKKADDPGIEAAASAIRSRLDEKWGGFGTSMKFPPHSTLLFALYDAGASGREADREVVTGTLDSIVNRGLHDHLQGGFFRYCVDREWTIPHFEKMLYDQAMLLWTLSVAADLFGREDYREAALGTVRCLEETFRSGDAYVSAHDADTDHHEGGTYLFSYNELSSQLSADELALLSEAFEISATGNFEGKIHLVRREPYGGYRPESRLRAVLDKLLAFRRNRPQPSVDTKVITSWNCLAGIACVEAGRRLGMSSLRKRADEIEGFLLEHHVNSDQSEGDGGIRLAHSSNQGQRQEEEFLEDVAALLLFETYLLEERQFGDQESARRTREICAALAARLDAYRDGDRWFEAHNDDFVPVPAQSFDSPTPSSVSLAYVGRSRWALLSGGVPDPVSLQSPVSQDFLNIAALIAAGFVHEVHSPRLLDYGELPVHVIQVKSEEIQACYRGVCRRELPHRQG